MAEAGEADGRSQGLAEAEPDLSPRGEHESPGEHEDEPGLFSSSRSLPFATVTELVSFRSSSSASDISFRSSVGDLELEDDDMMYRLMQSEYEEIPSFRWIASPLRWWKTRKSRRRTHPSRRSNASGGASSRMEKPGLESDAESESGVETRDGLVFFDGHPAYTIEQLLKSSAVLLGRGTFGTMYGATFADGKQVAVKRLALGERVITREEFEDEVNALGRIRHPNLMRLTAYYYSKDEKLLVFDYMPMGSLWEALHVRRRLKYLDWPTRMNIAIGIARGLHYLHTEENMVHGNLTSRNVLLDDLTHAKISDYGISNIRTAATDPARVKAEALWYHAPEFSNLKMVNTKTDVYSLGVIIIEILTGKSPEKEIDGLALQQWVALTAKEEKTYEAFDLDLLRPLAGTTEDELVSTLYLAWRCVDPSPPARPEVLQVLLQLERIKQGIAGGTGAATAKGGGSGSSPSSILETTEERTTTASEADGLLETSQTFNVLANEENARCVAEKIISSLAEAFPEPINSCEDDSEELSNLTSQVDLNEEKNIPFPAPVEENIQGPLGNEELQVRCEMGDAQSVALPLQARDFYIHSSTDDQLKGNEFLEARQAQPKQNTDPKKEAEEHPQSLPIAPEGKMDGTMRTEGVDATSRGVPVSPLSSINWAEVTLQARLEVPTLLPLITSDPDQGYQRFFKTLYDLAHRSPPLPSTVLEVQLNRMVIGLQSLGYPLDAWLKAATLVLVSAEKREYIERLVGDYEVHVEAQLTECASIVAPVEEDISRTRSDITTLEQKQEELDDTITKLKDQLAAAKETRKEVACSLATARAQLAMAEAKMESLSVDMDQLNRHYSEIPKLTSAMLHELPALDEVFDSSFREIMTSIF